MINSVRDSRVVNAAFKKVCGPDRMSAGDKGSATLRCPAGKILEDL